MERFTDQALRLQPHLAVLFYDSIGDFVVATPLLRGLRDKYPGCTIDYFGGERTAELESASSLLASRFSLFSAEGGFARLPAYVAERVRVAGPYDLAINCEAHVAARLALELLQSRYVVGPAFAPDLRSELPQSGERVDTLHDEVWNAADLLERYAGALDSQYIGEILCRLARVETDYARTEVPEQPPSIATPAVLISTGANRSAKLWPAPYWRQVIEWCSARGLDVGLLGSRPADQARYYHSVETESQLLADTRLIDLRGRLTLPEAAGALRRARLCVTIDNGVMHLAGAVGTPTVAIFGASPWRLWAPRTANVRVLLPADPCLRCEENRFRNSDCLLPEQVCMLSMRPERVIGAMAGALGVAVPC